MRYCLVCPAEYASSPVRCPDCHSRTVTAEERALWLELRDDLTHEQFVPIHVFDGPADKAFITEILSQEAVPWVVHGDDRLGGTFHSQSGWGVLLVAEDAEGKARDLVRQYQESVVLEPEG